MCGGRLEDEDEEGSDEEEEEEEEESGAGAVGGSRGPDFCQTPCTTVKITLSNKRSELGLAMRPIFRFSSDAHEPHQ